MYLLYLMASQGIGGETCPRGWDECILSYKQSIRVKRNGSIRVREDIKVRATGDKIKRGIYRDFPVEYRDRRGRTYRVGFKVVKVFRDGEPENWFTKEVGRYTRVYMGKEDVYLKPGVYTYTLIYETDRQIGFFKEHDELYWNVTGNRWEFPIMSVLAVVSLPKGVPRDRIKYTAYTGETGERGKDYEARIDERGRVHFETTRPLSPREGLTIVVGWPKGYVKAAGFMNNLFRDYGGDLSLWLVVLALATFYFIGWIFVGRDPKRGPAMPVFNPPGGLSPAAIRYLYKMDYDAKCLVSNMISSAVKGVLKIKNRRDEYRIVREGMSSDLTEDERLVAMYFEDSRIRKGANNYYVINPIYEALRDELKKRWGGTFRSNKLLVLAGIWTAIVALVILSFFNGVLAQIVPSVVILVFVAIGLFIVAIVIAFITDAIAKAVGKDIQDILGWFFFVPTFLLVMFALWKFGLLSLSVVNFLLVGSALYFTYVLGRRYLPRPSKEISELLSQIEGFRMFLKTAEKERLEKLFPGESFPKIYERFLPYALALDVADTWANRFADTLKSMNYRPEWYSGDVNELTSFPESLSVSVHNSTKPPSSTSTDTSPPGSTSGFGESGHSGGGGGGGGGGGW